MEIELRSMEHHRGLELRSTSTERLELISGRQRRGRGRCCWLRHYLGADALQHAEGSEPLEQKGALHLGEHSVLLRPAATGSNQGQCAAQHRHAARGQRSAQAGSGAAHGPGHRGQGQTETCASFWFASRVNDFGASARRRLRSANLRNISVTFAP
eukprot:scaffold144250_cov196-Phaeocystis_antarctica.AAC.1